MKSTSTFNAELKFWRPLSGIRVLLGFYNRLAPSHPFLSSDNGVSLHTEQGPIRSNLHRPNYWCRFIFVGGEAKALFPDPHTVGKDKARWAGGRRLEWRRVRAPSNVHASAHDQIRAMSTHSPHLYAGKKAPHLKCSAGGHAAKPPTPQSVEGRRTRDVKGGRGWRDAGRQSWCTDSTVTGLNYPASAQHWKEFSKDGSRLNRLMPTFTGLSCLTASLWIKILIKGRAMQGEMAGMAPERRCHAKTTCSEEVGSEGKGRRQRVVLGFVFCKIVPKYHRGPLFSWQQ